ncbi:GrpB family protein [Luteimicrobium sp. DT211]|uniref:GrpB family protein n=1 Tax=Luteimicrobium sp. DT211 TaxID=3393412 RepID=UPI003CEADBA6
MPITVVPYSDEWPAAFGRVAAALRSALAGVVDADVEHVGSTSVPGLAAKPVLDVDVIVAPDDVRAAVRAVESVGYVHRGDLGVTGREAFHAPDDDPVRHVYVCVRGTLNVRNHLAVRDVLRRRPDLRDEYGAVKLALAADPVMDIVTYVARKSGVLQRVLAEAGLTDAERYEILRLNTDPEPATSPTGAGD